MASIRDATLCALVGTLAAAGAVKAGTPAIETPHLQYVPHVNGSVTYDLNGRGSVGARVRNYFPGSIDTRLDVDLVTGSGMDLAVRKARGRYWVGWTGDPYIQFGAVGDAYADWEDEGLPDSVRPHGNLAHWKGRVGPQIGLTLSGGRVGAHADWEPSRWPDLNSAIGLQGWLDLPGDFTLRLYGRSDNLEWRDTGKGPRPFDVDFVAGDLQTVWNGITYALTLGYKMTQFWGDGTNTWYASFAIGDK
ncbi:hypothetical protein HYT54_00015 [Candidatus Woesearchaeota archaeon]|nr:hypothetical protein [Candidatus Woesearchaeota archaeon]